MNRRGAPSIARESPVALERAGADAGVAKLQITTAASFANSRLSLAKKPPPDHNLSMAKPTGPVPLLSPADMRVVESVLGTDSSYVLDLFNDHGFNLFILREVGVDANAPQYSEGGKSKVDRLKRILHSLPAGRQAKLLSALLRHMEQPIHARKVGKIDPKLREAYQNVVRGLEQQVQDADNYYSASEWTGIRTVPEQVEIVRQLGPLAQQELLTLAETIENARLNEPINFDAVQCLRELHGQLGELIAAVDRSRNPEILRKAVEAIEINRRKFIQFAEEEGARFVIIAPAMTYGVVNILSWLTGVPVDTNLIGRIYTAIVGVTAAKAFKKKSSLAK